MLTSALQCLGAVVWSTNIQSNLRSDDDMGYKQSRGSSACSQRFIDCPSRFYRTPRAARLLIHLSFVDEITSK